MDLNDLSALGITSKELQNRVVERICEGLLYVQQTDEDGDEYPVPSKLKTDINKRIQEAIDTRVAAMFEAQILPKVADMVDGIVLQETTSWGEKKGEPMTFTEYLVRRADAYLREEVNFEGHSKAESRDGYNWRKHTTRVSQMVHAHLHYELEAFAKKALAEANAGIAAGIHGAVKIALETTLQKLDVKVTTK